MEDSETENECFESAEESLDEEEKNDVCTKAKTNLCEGGRESSEPVSSEDSRVSSGQKSDEQTSGNTTSYRKRPERVKRLPSIPSNKNNSKPSETLIIKPDKIIPDVFLQDIASNLSKNINKSLSSLQQTSSNVKDMIFSSLSVSSLSNNEGFSYDDKNVFSTSVDTPQDTHFEISGVMKDIEKREQDNVEITTTKDINFSPDVRQSEHTEELNTKKSNSDNNSEEIPEQNYICEEIKNQDINPESEENLDSPDNACLSVEPVENTKDNDIDKISAFEIDNSDNSETGENTSEPVDHNSQTVDINTTDINNSTEDKNQEDLTSNIKNTLTNELVQNNEDDVTVKTNELPNLTNSSNIDIDLKISESNDNSESLKSSAVIVSSEVSSEEQKSDSECNLKELKNALKNIIKDEENVTENAERNSSVEKIESICEKNITEDQSSKDGWDDFDFSDVEDENVGDKGKISENIDVKKEDKSLYNQEYRTSVPVVENKRKNNSENEFKKENIKTNSINSSLEFSLKKSNDQNLVNNNQKMVNKDNEKGKETVNNNDGWDWDAWEEENDESQETNDSKTSNFKSDNQTESPSDLSKWSGWDNFGQKAEEKPGNWGLGSWGVDMLLNKATAVTQGISNVLEAGLGAPDPETLARMEKMERENLIKQRKEETDENYESFEVSKKNSLTNVNLFPVSGLTSLVAGVTSKIVEHSKIQEIGSKVITGGLDTLETFGKKTMEVLQDGDPGLRNKRAFLLGNEEPAMSQLLREAKEIAEREIKMAEERDTAKKYNFEALFDDYQGMVHLEALEMLSTQYELKLEQLRNGMKPDEQEDFNSILEEVEQLCSFDETDLEFKASSNLDFKVKLERAIEPLENEISIQKILQIHSGVTNWLKTSNETKPSLKLVHQKIVATLAELAAATVQQFHKSGELLSVKECRKTVAETDSLLRFTNVLCTEINNLCEKFITYCKELNRKENNDETLSSLTQNVNVIMTNSTSYIRQAFNLLIPVLQYGAAVY